MSATPWPSSWPPRSMQARDAAEAIAVEWEPLPHVIGARAALQQDAPLVWPEATARGNLAFETELGDADATARGFAEAARTVSLTLVNQRLVANYLDTRGGRRRIRRRRASR